MASLVQAGTAVNGSASLASSLTFAKNCDSRATLLILLIAGNMSGGSPATPSTVTYNGVGMTKQVDIHSNTSRCCSIWTLASPTTGSSQNVVINAPVSSYIDATAIEVWNTAASPIGAIGTGNNNSNTSSLGSGITTTVADSAVFGAATTSDSRGIHVVTVGGSGVDFNQPVNSQNQAGEMGWIQDIGAVGANDYVISAGSSSKQMTVATLEILPATDASVTSLSVGAGGGASEHTGGTGAATGGGAGQFIKTVGLGVNFGSYTITVGTGGAKATGAIATDGGSTSGLGITSLGGKGGTQTAAGNCGDTTHLGGANANSGGGGTSANGSTGTNTNGAAGGAGTADSITGSSVTYGQGGGGGGTNSTGGTGYPNNGDNTGDGGLSGAYGNGNRGASGVYIISYTTGSYTCTGGTITTSGGKTIHTFTSNGTFVIGAFVAALFSQKTKNNQAVMRATLW